MKIIGHRGAAGLGLENSHDSFKAALQYDLYALEFDVHLTKDQHLVVVHDKHTKRVSETKLVIGESTLEELKDLLLNNRQHLPTLQEILDAVGSQRLIIEIKDKGTVPTLLKVLAANPQVQASVASFHHSELQLLRTLRPDIPIYVLEHVAPVDIIHSARRLHAYGIGLNKWLMNPLTYRLAKQNGIELYVYTVNNKFIFRFLRFFYPEAIICTDRPDLYADRKKPAAGKKRSRLMRQPKR
jgi:glycerophosphoryl diester phosphodiesterase